MTDRELDDLLAGQAGVVLRFTNGELLWLDRHDLATPLAWRGAMRRRFGHLGYEPPVYDQDDHDTIVRVIFRLIAATEHEDA